MRRHLGLADDHRLLFGISFGYEDTTVRASRGTAPATNPFILVNANGTDFRRSDDRLDLDTLQLTLNFRF